MRVSTEEQAKGYSIAAQLEECKAFCLEKGWEYLVFQDVESGASDERKGMLMLEQALMNGEVSAVVVWRFDRLSRDFLHAVSFLYTARKRKVRVISVKEGELSLDLSPQDFVKLLATFGFGSLEWYAIRERTRIGRERALKEGRYLGKGAFGYTKEGHIKEDEAGVIRRIYSMVLEGYGLVKITKILNTENVLQREWSRSTVRAILKRPYYAGIVVPRYFNLSHKKLYRKLLRKEYYTLRDFQPVISFEEFLNVQRILAEKSVWKGRGKLAYEFSGIVKCGLCGRGVRLASSKGYYGLSCTASSREGRCKNTTVGLKALQKAFLKWLKDYLKNFEENVLELLNEQKILFEKKLEEERKALMASIERTKMIINRYFEDYERGILTGQATAERVKKKEEELRELEEKLTQLRHISFNPLDPYLVLTTLRELTDHWGKLPLEKKNSLLKSLLKEIRIFRNRAVLILFDDSAHELFLNEKQYIPVEHLPEHLRQIAQLYNEGLSIPQIAETLNMPYNRVRHTLTLLKKGRIPKRWKSTHTRTSHLYREEILSLYRQGLSVARIADRVGVSRSTVLKILLEKDQHQI